MSFLLAMVVSPHVQRKAQEELDRVVGSTHLPTFEDLESLPYIEAIRLEVMRWVPVLPLATPHRVVADDEYEGYLIPSGATVIGVRIAILSASLYVPTLRGRSL